MADSDPWAAGASIFSGALGAIGANQASKAQQAAARDAANTARRNAMMGIQINEPMRSTGYQALNDINSFFGYQSSPYTSANQLATTLSPLTSKQVKQAIKGGAGFDELSQMGTLGSGNKSIKRLMKAGLSMEQIQQLRTGMAPQQGTPQGGAQASGQPGQMNWDAITNAPDYQLQLQQGTKNMGNSFAARGGSASGNALRALSDFNQGLASQGLDKFINRRMGLVNGGQQAIGNVQQAGTSGANAMMDSQYSQGDARASGIYNQYGAIAGGLAGIGEAMGRRSQDGGYGGPTNNMYGPYSGGYQFPQQPKQYDWRSVLPGSY